MSQGLAAVRKTGVLPAFRNIGAARDSIALAEKERAWGSNRGRFRVRDSQFRNIGVAGEAVRPEFGVLRRSCGGRSGGRGHARQSLRTRQGPGPPDCRVGITFFPDGNITRGQGREMSQCCDAKGAPNHARIDPHRWQGNSDSRRASCHILFPEVGRSVAAASRV